MESTGTGPLAERRRRMSNKDQSLKKLKTFAYNSGFSSSYSQPAGRIHFGSLGRWINDPCGLVHCDGVYHLFYQLNPHGTEWGNMHWGHAVSSNLIHWEHRPIAISPHPEFGMAFTGSVVVDTENSSGFFPQSATGFVALLTTARESKDEATLVQTQSIAYSHDQGETWQWYSGNPVIADERLRDFRDPKIVRHPETKRWIMCISAGASIRFYRSNDLLVWECMSSYEPESVPDVCECPILIRFPRDGHDTWALAYSLANPDDAHFSGVRYVTGTFDGVRFLRDKAPERRLDQGPDFYAVQNWYGVPEKAESAIVAWANNPAYSHSLAAEVSGCTGIMTVPRRVTLFHGTAPMLRQTPVTDALMPVPLERGRVFHEPGSSIFESVGVASPFQIELQSDDSSSAGFAVFIEGSARDSGDERSNDVSGSALRSKEAVAAGSKQSRGIGPHHPPLLTVEFDSVDRKLVVCRNIPSTSVPSNMRETRTIGAPDPDIPLNLTAIIEEGIVELFAFDGTVTATYLLPDHPDPMRVRVTYDPDGAELALHGHELVHPESHQNTFRTPEADLCEPGLTERSNFDKGGDP